MNDVISRKEAIEKGLKTYFTGKPCKRGNIAVRMVANKSCTCDSCSQVQKDCLARYRKNNADKRRAGSKRWKEQNSKARAEYNRHHYAKNRERLKAETKRWRAENPDKIRVQWANRRAAKSNSVPSWVGEFDQLVFSEAAELCRVRKIETGIAWHSDHMIPLRARGVCGLHCASNIQVIPAAMNTSKQHKMALTNRLEWLHNGI